MVVPQFSGWNDTTDAPLACQIGVLSYTLDEHATKQTTSPLRRPLTSIAFRRYHRQRWRQEQKWQRHERLDGRTNRRE
jgi:hypothetical protein